MTKHKPRVKFVSPLAKAQHSKFQLIVWFCPAGFKKTAYISLVHSALKYSAAVWDPYQQNDTDNLENIQKCAARFINHNYKDCSPGCVTNMLRGLRLQSLQNRRKQQKLTPFFKIVRGPTPAIPANEFLTLRNSKSLIKSRNPTNLTRSNKNCYLQIFFSSPRTTIS